MNDVLSFPDHSKMYENEWYNIGYNAEYMIMKIKNLLHMCAIWN